MPELNETMLVDQSNTTLSEANAMVATTHSGFEVEMPPAPSSWPLDFYNPGGNDIYFYHPDHLGSSSSISNAAGIVTQHAEYLPFGEMLVDEHLNSYNTPFKFNGKEYENMAGKKDN